MQAIILIALVVAAIGSVSFGAYVLTRPPKPGLRIMGTAEFTTEFSPYFGWLLEEFTKRTGIEIITYEAPAWEQNREKLLTFFVSGQSTYDLVYTTRDWTKEFAEYLYPLNDWITDEMRNEVISDAFDEENGDILAIYWLGWCRMLYYNTELFEAAGITEPPRNWNELLEYAIKLTDPEKDQWGLLSLFGGTTGVTQELMDLILKAGGDFQNFNSSAGVRALQFYCDLFNKYKVIDPVSLECTYSADTGNIWSQGKHAMMMGSDSQWPFFENEETSKVIGKYKVAVQPVNVSARFTGGGMDGWAIPKVSKNKEAAWEFIEFQMSHEVLLKEKLEAGWSVTSPSVMSDPTVMTETPTAQAFADTFDTMEAYHFEHAHFGEFVDTLTTEVMKAINGDKTPEQALDDAMAAILAKGIFEG